MTSLFAAPTSTQLLTLDGQLGRTEGFRIDVLDAALAVVGQLHPTRPGLVVDNNINRDIKRTLSGMEVTAADLATFDVFAHRVRPMWLLGDGTEWPLGVFVVADASRTRSTLGLTSSLSLVDQGLILAQPLAASVGYPAGASIGGALTEQCTLAGLPSFTIDSTDATVGSPVTWPSGSAKVVQVLNDLAALAGFTSGYFDNAGTYRLRRAGDLGASTLPDFDYDYPARVYAGSIVESDATLDAPNRYVVTSSSAEQQPVVGVWDVPDAAPHSYYHRGFRVVSTLEVQGLAGQEAAEAAAMRIGQSALATYAWASFSAAPDPRHDTFQVVRWQGQLWREQSWSVALVAGAEHHHELRRLYTPSA